MAAAEQWRPEHIRVAWEPLPGSQLAFLTCPVTEVLYHGSRGPGKTDSLLMDFAQFTGRGYGAWWRGVIFRRREKDLEDLIAKSKRWFHQIFPRAQYLIADKKWRWPTGEELLFAIADKPDDYWTWHGQEYPYVGWEELTTWPNLELYELMKSINRSSRPGMPRRYRSTANPWGAGHHAVKDYFIDAAPERVPVTDAHGNVRLHIQGRVEENRHLLEADPQYIARLDAIRNPELRKAWRLGDWTVNPGGFLQGIFDHARHVVAPFSLPVDWPRWRALDWGSARPFSVGWYALNPDSRAIYRYRELYGWAKRPDVGCRLGPTRVAEFIKRAEAKERTAGVKFRNNPADSACWAETGIKQGTRDITIASQFADAKVDWDRARKGPGSRISGAQVVIDLLQEDRFFVFDTCRHWIRTVPALQPDPDDWEDVDTEMEDHCFTGDTRVITARGSLRLDCLADRPDLWRGVALSSDGWREYRSPRLVYPRAPVMRLRFDDGSEVRCTPDHRFLTEDGAWTEARRLRGRWIRSWSQPPARTSAAGGTGAAARTFATALASFIATCGARAMAPFLQITRSTTATATGPTTGSPTWSCSLAPGTGACTHSSETSPGRVGRRVPATPLHDGTAAPRAADGTASTTSAICEMYTLIARWRNGARCAARRIARRGPSRRAPATAPGAAGRVRCVSVEPAGREPVYCMTVPATGALVLANGLIASNCWDETRYSLVSRHRPARKEPRDTTPKAGTFQHLIEAEAQQEQRSRFRRRSAP